MSRLIVIIVLSVLLGGTASIAQIVETPRSSAASSSWAISSPPMMPNTQLVGGAPVGHRQPHLRDVSSENPRDLEHISADDVAVDRKLVICRGC